MLEKMPEFLDIISSFFADVYKVHSKNMTPELASLMEVEYGRAVKRVLENIEFEFKNLNAQQIMYIIGAHCGTDESKLTPELQELIAEFDRSQRNLK